MTKPYQLPKVFAEKWVAALRGGEYGQCTGKLYDGREYCCLGVACVVSDVPHPEFYAMDIIESNISAFDSVPRILRGSSRGGNIVEILTGMNDKENKSFPEIADWIEANCQFTEGEVTNA